MKREAQKNAYNKLFGKALWQKCKALSETYIHNNVLYVSGVIYAPVNIFGHKVGFLFAISTDWLIDCCLTSSGKYFMHIQDGNKLANNKSVCRL